MATLGSHFGKRRSQAGFTIADALVASAVAVGALGGFYASTQQAQRVMRTGREVAQVSEALQERIEALRYAPPWTNITTPSGVAAVVASKAAAAANFSAGLTESYTIEPYPSGSPLTVTRSPNGTFTNNGVDVSSSPCVKVTVVATWTGLGNVPRSRRISTIMSKGGI